MILTLNLDREYGSPEGICRMWLFRPLSLADKAALVVLSALPRDKGPGLPSHYAEVATAAMHGHGLIPANTIWVIRQVLPDRRERYALVDLAFDGRRLRHPSYEPTTRAAVEILATCELPAVAEDEVPR